MKIELHSTTKIVEINGVPARIWEGSGPGGVPVHAFITRLGVPEGADHAEFQRELEQHAPPSVDVAMYPPYLRIAL